MSAIAPLGRLGIELNKERSPLRTPPKPPSTYSRLYSRQRISGFTSSACNTRSCNVVAVTSNDTDLICCSFPFRQPISYSGSWTGQPCTNHFLTYTISVLVGGHTSTAIAVQRLSLTGNFTTHSLCDRLSHTTSCTNQETGSTDECSLEVTTVSPVSTFASLYARLSRLVTTSTTDIAQ